MCPSGAEGGLRRHGRFLPLEVIEAPEQDDLHESALDVSGDSLLDEMEDDDTSWANTETSAEPMESPRELAKQQAHCVAQAGAEMAARAQATADWRCGWCSCALEDIASQKLGPAGVDTLCDECGTNYQVTLAATEVTRERQQIAAAVRTRSQEEVEKERRAEQAAKKEALHTAREQMLERIKSSFESPKSDMDIADGAEADADDWLFAGSDEVAAEVTAEVTAAEPAPEPESEPEIAKPEDSVDMTDPATLAFLAGRTSINDVAADVKSEEREPGADPEEEMAEAAEEDEAAQAEEEEAIDMTDPATLAFLAGRTPVVDVAADGVAREEGEPGAELEPEEPEEEAHAGTQAEESADDPAAAQEVEEEEEEEEAIDMTDPATLAFLAGRTPAKDTVQATASVAADLATERSCEAAALEAELDRAQRSGDDEALMKALSAINAATVAQAAADAAKSEEREPGADLEPEEEEEEVVEAAEEEDEAAHAEEEEAIDMTDPATLAFLAGRTPIVAADGVANEEQEPGAELEELMAAEEEEAIDMTDPATLAFLAGRTPAKDTGASVAPAEEAHEQVQEQQEQQE